METDYQKITEKIAEEAGLQTGAKQYIDPIYTSWMEGNFLRSLLHTRHPWAKMSVSIIVFFIPASFRLVVGTLMASDHILSYIVNLLLAILLISIGIKIFISGIRDF